MADLTVFDSLAPFREPCMSSARFLRAQSSARDFMMYSADLADKSVEHRATKTRLLSAIY